MSAAFSAEGSKDEAAGKAWARRSAVVGVAIVTVASALALAGAEVHVQLGAAFCSVLCGALAWYGGSLRRLPAPALLLAGLGLFSLLQSAPLPLWLLRVLSPKAADIWSRCLLPFGDQVRFGSLSLDPGASSLEGAKWLAYSLVFCLASSFAKRRGPAPAAALVLGSAVVIAFASLGHNLVGATRVFGIYEPRLGIEAGHIGPFLNTNALAGYMVLGTFCGVGLALTRRGLAPTWVFATGAIITASVAIRTGSRGGAAALLVGSILCALMVLGVKEQRGRMRRFASRHWLGATAGILVVLAFTVLTANHAWPKLTHTNLDTLKIGVWAIPMLRDFALFGVGRGAFESAFPAYKPAGSSLDYSHPENILVQWTAEWGLVIGALGLASFAWLFRPRRLGFERSGAGAGAQIGVVAISLQNLVDFSLELFAPMLAVTLILGSVWAQRASSERPVQRSAVQRSACATLIVGATVACVLAFARGLSPVPGERLDLHAQYERSSRDELAARGALWSTLRAAMLRHPSEPYLPRLGALMALRAGNIEPMPWLNAALERGPSEARTHWILAQVLQRHGLLPQALLEARLTVEQDGTFASLVGGVIARWTSRFDDLKRAVPPGPSGAVAWFYAASALPGDPQRALREQLFREAIARDPSFGRARLSLAEEQLQEFARAPRDETRSEILAQAAALERSARGSADPSILRVRLYGLGDQAQLAERELTSACPALEPNERARCWNALLSVSLERAGWPKHLTEKATEEYVKAACLGEEQCQGALRRAGDAMAQKGEFDLALGYYERAVNRLTTVDGLLRVADAAIAVRRYPIAMRALTRAESQAGAASEVGRLIGERRQAILLQSLR